jgi:hypothetical protein
MGARSAMGSSWGVRGACGKTFVAVTLAFGGLVAGALSSAGTAGAASAASDAAAPPFAHACGTPLGGHAACTAIRLLTPARNWQPRAAAAKGASHGGGGPAVALPSQGYYPGDLQSAYGLANVASSMTPGAATVAIVDAYDDPTAASNLAAYRTALSKATDQSTGLTDGAIPPLCSSTVTSGCVTFTKVNQSGGTSYPRATAGWSEEISVDLDMVSAICPACNIVLVEASSASMSNLAAAVRYAKSLHPAAVANSYGASEFSSETTFNATYSATTSSAITAATGDSGYGAEFPAASPRLTAVGGTSLTFSGTGSNLVWNPQSVWSTAGAGCSAYEPMPAWQAVTGVYRESAHCTNREIGDVAAVANPYTGVAVYDTYHATGWMVFGGTSVATQIIGATYGLAAGTGALRATPSGLYPDKTTTSTGATPGLTPVTSGHDGSCGNYLCNATDRLASGYNGPTGLGTPDGVGAFQGPAATSGSLSFTPTSATLIAGSTSEPLTVHLSTAAPGTGLTVTLSTSSSGGGFSTSSSGSFTNSLVVTVTGGSTASAPFYYRDTVAGSPSVTATATGWSSALLSVTVSPGPLATLTISPSTASVAEGGTVAFHATGADAYGNAVTVNPSWSVTSASLGTFSPTTGASTTFTASSTTAGTGTVTAATGTVSGTATLTVTNLSTMTLTLNAGTVSKKGSRYHVPLTVDATTSSGSALSGATAALEVFSGSCTGSPVATGTGTTGTNGKVTFTFTTRQVGTWCALASVSASGYEPGSATTTFTT